MKELLHTAYIGLGSNLGDKTLNLTQAISRLQNRSDCQVLKVSSFYETEPLTKNGVEVGWYLNSALKLKTSLSPVSLLGVLLEIEKEMGRPTDREKWTPRIIDLDLLFYNQEIVKTRPLKIPHPELHKRRFVLEPLAEIAPHLLHPVKGVSVEALLEKLVDDKKVVPLFRFFLSRNAAEALG